MTAGSRITGYATGDPDQQHVNVVGADLHLHELVYSTASWSDNDLTPLSFFSIRQAMGRWTVPAISRPDYSQPGSDGYRSSTWVGIDGYGGAPPGSNDVLQAGTAQILDGDDPEYSAWLEWFIPGNPDNSPDYVSETRIDGIPVAPGDEMLCSSTISMSRPARSS